MSVCITETPEGVHLSAYGIEVDLPERPIPDLSKDQRIEVERSVVDAVTAREKALEPSWPPLRRREPDLPSLAQDLLGAAAQGLRDAPCPEQYRQDLEAMSRTLIVSRGAVISSQPYEVGSLVIGSVLDTFRTWCLIGDWPSRDLNAAEALARLAEDEGGHLDISADHSLVKRLVEESESLGLRVSTTSAASA